MAAGALAALVVGCGAQPSTGALADHPSWATQVIQREGSVHAAGRAEGIASPALRASTADASARAALAARIIPRLNTALDHLGLSPEREQEARAALEALSFDRPAIVTRYVAHDQPVTFSLARADQRPLELQIEMMEGLHEKTRAALYECLRITFMGSPD